jgi:hypothetical protein
MEWSYRNDALVGRPPRKFNALPFALQDALQDVAVLERVPSRTLQMVHLNARCNGIWQRRLFAGIGVD